MARKANRRNSRQRGLRVLHENVAGVDLGSTEHWVCCPSTTQNDPNVRVFGTTTVQLERLCRWLKEQNVVSVAMESTGVYWIPLFEMLERKGIKALLVDSRHLSRVPGRKTDMQDCQWIQLLHSCGLLASAFRPAESICQLRAYIRARGSLVREGADWLRRMQKELDQMNVRVHRAVSDISGTTGMSIIRAIVHGQRDPVQLAKLRHPNCHLSEREIAQELTGTWHEEHLFNLKEALHMYDFIQERLDAYDRRIQEHAESMQRSDIDPYDLQPPKSKDKARKIKADGQEPLRKALYAMCGVDLTAIDGISVDTARTILGEIGPDVSAFANEKQFKSYATLAPNMHISGGKSQRRRSRGQSHRLGQALKMAAVTLRNSKSALGAYYRRIAMRACIAVFSTAGKLSQIVYRMLRYGEHYVDIGQQAYEEQFRQRKIRALTRAAKELGYKVLAVPKAELNTT